MISQKQLRFSALQPGRVVFLPLASIRPNPAQPRKIFDVTALQELAAREVRKNGLRALAPSRRFWTRI